MPDHKGNTKDLQEIYSDTDSSIVTHTGYETKCVHYHSLSSTDGNSECMM